MLESLPRTGHSRKVNVAAASKVFSVLSKDADCRWLPAGEGAHSSEMHSDINQLAGEPVRELLSRYSNMNFFNFIKHPLVGTP